MIKLSTSFDVIRTQLRARFKKAVILYQKLNKVFLSPKIAKLKAAKVLCLEIMNALKEALKSFNHLVKKTIYLSNKALCCKKDK